MRFNIIFLSIMLSIILIYSCSDDDNSTEPVNLVADAGPTQQVNPFELVTLDDTGSTGPEVLLMIGPTLEIFQKNK